MPRKSASKRTPSQGSAQKKPTKKKAGRKRAGKKAGPSTNSTQRLQRLLASAGFGSRRQCEELIEAGRVVVDGAVVKLGTTVDPAASKVHVDGVLLKKQKLVYYAVNKPIGFVTTNRDPQGRPRVVDMVPPDERVFPVGRLDRNSEGLILLTNDGELAQRLTHPKFGVRKVYRVTVAGKVDPETMKQMRKGVYIAEGFVKVEGAKLLKSRSRSTEMEIVLREGKNREIRRILARLGHKVQHLRRIAVGPLRLGDVPPGAYRVLSHQEVDKLWQVTETSSDASPKKLVRKKPGKAKSGGTKTGGKRATGKQYAGKQPAKKSNRRPVKKPAEEFVFDDSQTIGSVIGADATPTPDAPDRRTRSTKGKRKARTSERQTTEKRGGKKSAGRKSSSSSGRPKRRGKTSSPVTGKRGGTKRGSVKHGTKRGTKRKHSGRNRKH